MIRLFVGHEDRIAVGTTAFIHSVLQHARQPVAITPLSRRMFDGLPEGSNAFTFSRFLVPWLCDYEGLAVFVDGSDMLCRGDIGDIVSQYDGRSAVQCVKHSYATQHPRKYVGTGMECDNLDYERKQWASVMLMQCSHYAWRQINPQALDRMAPLDLLQLRFIEDERIGTLTPVWNWLADEHGAAPHARIAHWTAGVPAIAAYAQSPMAEEWHAAVREATGGNWG